MLNELVQWSWSFGYLRFATLSSFANTKMDLFQQEIESRKLPAQSTVQEF